MAGLDACVVSGPRSECTSHCRACDRMRVAVGRRYMRNELVWMCPTDDDVQNGQVEHVTEEASERRPTHLAWLKEKRKQWPAAGDRGKNRRSRRSDGLPISASCRTRAHAVATTMEKLMREECSAPAMPAGGAPPPWRSHRHQAVGGIREHR
ncbi:hypothetical protein TRIUR3_29759 [Triticum urartu]|uniref:Uncharacterized protein n=1 Tax=Triticum urartu TaxID=4572 RepID=M7ZH87_TRIUA|nr:hypothetical protein TRIUR3_29759 [Triticum urartu]